MLSFSKDELVVLSDNELISLCRDSNPVAETVLISRYIPMVSKRVSVLCSASSLDRDDLVQEGLIAVFAAIKSFDLSLSSFSTFARICVDRALIDIVRSEHAKKQIPDALLTSFEELDVPAVVTPELAFIQKEKFLRLYEKFHEILSAFECGVLKAYLTGMSYEEIANSLSTSPKSVNNALTRIRRKLKSVSD